MTYYLMTMELIDEYINVRKSIREAHVKAHEELGYKYVSSRDSNTKRWNFTEKMKVAHQPETDFLNTMPIAIGKRKAEVIKSATIIASGAVPAQSGSTVVVDEDDGMALTDILLIVLVVLIVIMAIIVALRMMRS